MVLDLEGKALADVDRFGTAAHTQAPHQKLLHIDRTALILAQRVG